MSALTSFLPSAAALTGDSAGTPDYKISYSLASQTSLLQEAIDKASTSGANFQTLVSGGGSLQDTSTNSVTSIYVTEASVTASQVNDAVDNSGIVDTDHKVKLVSRAADGAVRTIKNDPFFPTEPLSEYIVEFDIMPNVTEQRNVEYEPISASQMPGEFQKYKGTRAVSWTINGTFACRTKAEALRNYVFLNNLRGWCMPYFGDLQRTQFAGKLGAPPPVLDFSGWRGIVGKVPVVVTSVNWTWPRDCDWIPTGIKDAHGQEIPFPTVMEVNVNIVESFSANQFNSFDLAAFRNGRMIQAYGGSFDSYEQTGPAEPIGGNQVTQGGTPTAQSSNTATSAQYNIFTSGDLARFERSTESPTVFDPTADTNSALNGSISDI